MGRRRIELRGLSQVRLELSLVLVFAFYMLVDGIFAIVSAVRAARGHGRWGLLLLQGVVSLAAAAAAALLPGVAVITFVFLVAAWMIVSGILAVAAAVRLRSDHGRWWMGFGGVRRSSPAYSSRPRRSSERSFSLGGSPPTP